VLTSTGKTFAVLAVLLTVTGWLMHYASLLAIGLACVVALVAATVWVARRPRVRAVRELHPERITVGQRAMSELHITNLGRRRTSSGVALEQFGNRVLPVELPGIDPEATATVTQPLPSEKRGVFQVGPLIVSRSDPFGLIRVGQQQRDVATFYVHPRIVMLTPFPSGVQRDLDGTSAGEAPEGGIAFQNLREYVEGDDLRLVHWRSLAKTGTLMVRHNVDTHQPRSVIVLDTREHVYTDESFEDAVEVTASIVMASMLNHFPFRLETTCGRTANSLMTKASVMDMLASLTLVERGAMQNAVGPLSRDPGGASLAVVSGRCTSVDLACLAPIRKRFDSLTIGRLGVRGSEVVLAPNAVLINAANVAEFARGWNRRAR
jgi:uncharacterized protein (DUF58 family)